MYVLFVRRADHDSAVQGQVEVLVESNYVTFDVKLLLCKDNTYERVAFDELGNRVDGHGFIRLFCLFLGHYSEIICL